MMFLRKKPPIVTDEGKITTFLTRGVEQVYPSPDFLRKKLSEGQQLSMYLGIDPTGPTLHIGHAIILKKLREFQQLGHKVILLIGDFTGMIGDPTDKMATRKPLTEKEVLQNARLYKTQASRFVTFSGPNKAELRYNSDWLADMDFEDVLKLLSRVTVDQMLKRDMFQKRIEDGKPIHLHEFLYPVMQGYDSVAMKVDGEIGGNDQTFNMLTGRTLMKDMLNKEKFVMTMKLLADQSGKKMGKTEGNIIAFTDSAQEMFGKVMSWTDGMIAPGFELCTDVSLSEVDMANPRNAKVRLAKEIVSFYHNKEAADKAEENFENTFKKGGVAEDAVEAVVSKETLLVDVLLQEKLVASKTEFRRLIDEGAITIVESDQKVTDPLIKIDKDQNLKIGKRRFIKIKVK